MRKLFLILFGLAFAILRVYGQTIVVGGQVISANDKMPIPGVTVLEKNTLNGTITDIDGKFKIETKSNSILVFSYIGMKTLEESVNGRTRIDIELTDDNIKLDEVIVVGYSTSSKKLISGSVGAVSESEIKNVPLRTIDGVLQGKTAGVSITQNSGTPGGQSTIKLRGGSSINAGNQPLIIIDGVPAITGSFGQIGYSGQEIDALSDLSPGDIESFTILKDASATAIYGARASNGVILITTKKGSLQKTDVNLSTNYGIQSFPSERIPELMNAQQWNEYKGTNVQGIDTDWMKEILRTAPTSNTELSLSSGNDKTRVFMSGNFYNQEGTVRGTSFNRYSGRLNVDHKILQNLSVGANFSSAYSKNNRDNYDGCS